MIQLTDKAFALEVSGGSHDIKLINDGETNFLRYVFSMNFLEGKYFEDAILPPGNWEYLCTTNGATEEDARKVVDKFHELSEPQVYKDYSDNVYRFPAALDSLRSLLKSKNLTGNYALLINNQNK